tara:strand:- start:2137 stop:2778 length:642 start_codon:yes stop_codon:yes gene_type:complete
MKFLKKLQKKFQNRFHSFVDEKSKSKVIAFILFALPFLPIIPYSRTDNAIYLFGVLEGSADNFYDLGINILNKDVKDVLNNPSKFDEGRALFELIKLIGKPIPSAEKHKNYLIKKGLSKDLAFCISLRDALFYDYIYQNIFTKSINKYKPSPVPIVWFFRSALISGFLLELNERDDVDMKLFGKLDKRCNKYKNIIPPKKYFNNEFSFSSGLN